MEQIENKINAFNRTTVCCAWLVLLFSGCGEGGDGQGGSQGEQYTCDLSVDCPESLVCREDVCVSSTLCVDNTECLEGERCIGGRCYYDPGACVDDGACGAGEICLWGDCLEGCRDDSGCLEIEFCAESLVCERLPCTVAPCDVGYICVEETGFCEALPCLDSCEPPMVCRESDDRCVYCLEHDDCEVGEFCDEEGLCRQSSCETHEDCPDSTFCISGFCGPAPDCEDDVFEDNDTMRTAGSAGAGTHTGYVACPFDADYFQIVADGEHSLTITVSSEDENADFSLTLYNTVDVLFAQQAEGGNRVSIITNIDNTGIYTLSVYQAEHYLEAVPYSLYVEIGPTLELPPPVCQDDDFENNNEIGEETTLFEGRWTGLSICPDDTDLFLFSAESGELLEVCVTPDETHAVSLDLSIHSSTGESLSSGMGDETFCLEEDLVFTDDYIAWINASEPGGETSYHLTVDIRPGCRIYDDEYDQNGLNNALPLEGESLLEELADEDLPASLHLCPGDSDYWPVPLSLGDRLEATTTIGEGGGDLQMSLLRPTGTVRMASTGTESVEEISYIAEDSGTYFLRVYGEGDAMGPYSFDYWTAGPCVDDSMEDNDYPEEASPVSVFDSPLSLIRCAGDEDYFSLQVEGEPGGTLLSIRLEGVDTEVGLPLELEVLLPDGEALLGTGVDFEREVNIETEGGAMELLIRVYGDSPAQGAYSLVFESGVS